MSQAVLLGNVSITTPAVHELLRREIPLSWSSYGGWFLGHTSSTGHKNVELRTAQYRASFEPAGCTTRNASTSSPATSPSRSAGGAYSN